MNDLIAVKADKARFLLSQCADTKTTKKVVDMAHAAEIYARRQKLGRDSIDYAHAVVADAQRLLGEFLAVAEKNRGGGEKGVGRRGKQCGSSVAPHSTPTLDQSGISKKESSTAQLISRVSKKSPELFEAYRKNEARVNDFRRAEKRDQHSQRVVESARKPAVIAGPFDIILADPPWRYEHCEADNREIENHYTTATLEQIFKHLPDSKPDSILFLWATAPKLEEAFRVMAAWGFSYRSCAVWDKERMGMGYWWRVQHELLLVGVRGTPGCPPESERISSVIHSPRGGHSAKPDCVRQWIERAYPGRSKLEMYCRRPREGWAAWGNEV